MLKVITCNQNQNFPTYIQGGAACALALNILTTMHQGTSPTDPKTVLKHTLRTWRHEQQDAEYPARLEASRLILQAYKNNETILFFPERLQFSSLPDLSPLTQLKTIISENTGLKTTSKLPESLDYLDLGHNQLTTIAHLPKKLRVLRIDRNQLKDLPSVQNLNQLHTLLFEHNQIEEAFPIPESLKHICFDANPCAQKTWKLPATTEVFTANGHKIDPEVLKIVSVQPIDGI